MGYLKDIIIDQLQEVIKSASKKGNKNNKVGLNKVFGKVGRSLVKFLLRYFCEEHLNLKTTSSGP